MRNQTEQVLRGAIFILAALLFLSVVRAGCRAGALFGAKLPAVPTLENSSAANTNSPSVLKSTNVTAAKLSATNAVKPTASAIKSAPGINTNLVSTNLLTTSTNLPGTNVVSGGTYLAAAIHLPAWGTNGLAEADTNSASTNKPVKNAKRNHPPEMAGIDFGGMPGMPGRAAKLPAAIQTRVDKIVESEMFAPVMHPQPMALLGIAGETIFLRTANGLTGLLKADEPLDGVKLLRIGINRVLVEVDGQKIELMIFEGNGSESLLSNENHK